VRFPQFVTRLEKSPQDPVFRTSTGDSRADAPSPSRKNTSVVCGALAGPTKIQFRVRCRRKNPAPLALGSHGFPAPKCFSSRGFNVASLMFR